MSLWAIATDPIELRSNFTEDDLQTVIRAVYKQVLGNEHILECDRLTSAESLLRNGDITVRQFVSLVGQSDLYRSLFFERSSQYRFIELNFKHFLGRSPQDQAEISEHVRIYNEQGYGAEIDSYIDSDEYNSNFGENIAPYARGTSTQVGIKNVGFNRMFTLLGGAASNDSSSQAKLISDLGANLPTQITSPLGGAGYTNTVKRFKIAVAKVGGARVRQSQKTYEVDYKSLSKQIQNLQKQGAKIVSITEVG